MVNQFKIKELRKLDNDRLKEILTQIEEEIALFKSRYSIKLPKGKNDINWARAKQLKKAKARILTIIKENENDTNEKIQRRYHKIEGID